MTLPLKILSPERTLYEGSVPSLLVPGTEGDLGVLPGHAPFMTQLRPGTVHVAGARYFVRGGFLDVSSEGCLLLVEALEDVEALDVGGLKSLVANLKEDVTLRATEERRTQAKRDLSLAEARLFAAEHNPY